MQPIGTIHSPYKQKFGTPRQSGLVPEAMGRLILDPALKRDGYLDGLQDFSHLWILFHFHNNNQHNIQGKVQPPRLHGQKMGLFATRSPHRPNPIGLSLVRIVDINHQEAWVDVAGVDMIDQTPVLDIKPYIEQYDRVEQSCSGWVNALEDCFFEVQWQTNNNWLSDDQEKLVRQSLSQDLRNLTDRKQSDSEKVFKTQIENIDVHFRYRDGKVYITDLIKLETI